MVQTWLKHGSNMVQHGSNMVQHGSNVSEAWLKHGSNRAQTTWNLQLTPCGGGEGGAFFVLRGGGLFGEAVSLPLQKLLWAPMFTTLNIHD